MFVLWLLSVIVNKAMYVRWHHCVLTQVLGPYCDDFISETILFVHGASQYVDVKCDSTPLVYKFLMVTNCGSEWMRVMSDMKPWLLIFTVYCVVCPLSLPFSSKSSCRRRSRSPSGEATLSTCHVGVGSLWSQTLHWQKVSTQRIRTQPAPQSEI